MAFCCCGVKSSASVAAKNAVELRNLESLGLGRAPSPRLRRTEVQIPVTLNVYSLLEGNKKLCRMGMGVFHTGVVVYGIEWGYGEVVDNPNASGLFCVHPGQAAGTLYRTIRIGYTTRSPMQVDTILHRLENEWRSSEYHILHHNCNHFAQAVCDLLSTTEKLQVPAWCNRAARVGDKVIPRKLATKVQHMMDDEPPKAVAPPPVSNVNEIPMSVVPREWYLHPSIFQPMRYVGGSRPESVLSHSRTGGAVHATAHSGTRASVAGSSRYTVEYDILPPPGYEPPGAGSFYPHQLRREVFCATDENGSISRLTAIEEQPSTMRSSRHKSARKTTRSHRMPIPTKDKAGSSSSSPAAHPQHDDKHGGAGVSDDGVPAVAHRRASVSHPQSIVAVGSSRGSVLDTDSDGLLQSDGAEDFPPHNVARRDVLSPRTPPLPAREATSDAPEKHARDDVPAPCFISVAPARRNDGVLFSEAPLHAVRESSMHSSSRGASVRSIDDVTSNFFRESSIVLPPRRAQPVGCISTLSAASPQPGAVADKEREDKELSCRTSAEEKEEKDNDDDQDNDGSASSKHRSGGKDDEHTDPRAATATNETKLHPATAEANIQPQKRHSDVALTAGDAPKDREKTSSPQDSGTKQRYEFSVITALPEAPSMNSPTDVPSSMDTKKKSPAWGFLRKARNISSHDGPTKKSKKYLSSPPPSDADSHTDADMNFETVSDSSACSPGTQPNSALQPRTVAQHSDQAHQNTVDFATTGNRVGGAAAAAGTTELRTESVSAAAALTSSPRLPLALSTPQNSESHPLHVHAEHHTDGNLRQSPPSPKVLNNALSVPLTQHNMQQHTPVSGRRSGHIGSHDATPSAVRRWTHSSESSASESPLDPPRRHLPESATLPCIPAAAAATEEEQIAVTLPELPHLVSETTTPPTGSARRGRLAMATPERADAVASGGAATTGTSPATAHRQARRGNSSFVSEASPTPPAERARTPIPFARRRVAGKNNENSPLVLALDCGRDVSDTPALRASSLLNASQIYHPDVARRNSSHKGGEAGTSLSSEKVAHTPMAPFPRRPSLLHREKVASVKTTDLSHDGATAAASVPSRNLQAEFADTSLKSMPLSDTAATQDKA